MSELPVIVVGAGGHARVLVSALRLCGAEIAGLLDIDPAKHGATVCGARVIGDDSTIARYAPDAVMLVNGIGSVRRPVERRAVYERLTVRGYRFRAVIHPSAVVAEDVAVGPGAQLMAGTVVQTGTILGADVIVNTGATVDHDCAIGDHVHIAPGVTLSGNVKIGADSHVGAGATVIQGVRIGNRCMVRAGTVVLDDLIDDATRGAARAGAVP